MDPSQSQYQPITTSNSGSKTRMLLIIIGLFIIVDIAVAAFLFLNISDEPNAVTTESMIQNDVELETDSATFNTNPTN